MFLVIQKLPLTTIRHGHNGPVKQFQPKFYLIQEVWIQLNSSFVIIYEALTCLYRAHDLALKL
jgi:hypothetical protein